ncbi:NAD(P)/FAD-dependent oxidoreductase [Sagittula sp. S175]|uniref:NAD(P)/FAD-dependent oxidoreductase n=1 Tax=Sagittula sp. S175 TaxID=3415129 RepID=UPI003C797D97
MVSRRQRHDAALHVDVAVLGAGPAGVASALALRAKGLRVAVLGDAASDALKPGEYLPGSAQRLLRALGLGRVEEVLHDADRLPCHAKVSAWGGDDWAWQDSLHDPEGGGWHILRHRFEQRLAEAAHAQGVGFWPGRLGALADDGVDYRVELGAGATVLAPRLVDATGRRAWLVRRLAGPPVKGDAQMAVVGWFTTPDDGPVEQITRIRSVESGWWYTAPLPGRLRVVAFHGLAEAVSALHRDPDRFTRQAGEVVLARLIAPVAPLQACDACVQLAPHVAGPRWLAVGDAALSFDPLSSQGLQFALYSGIMAAEAICAALADPAGARNAMARYCAQVSDVYRTNQRTRCMFYLQERRFQDAPYWNAQHMSFADHGTGRVTVPMQNF